MGTEADVFPHGISAEEWWEKLANEFQAAADMLRSVRFESKAEALQGSPPMQERRVGREVHRGSKGDPKGESMWDDEIDASNKHPDLIVHRKTNDEELEEYFEEAKGMIPPLTELFEKRQATPEFMQRWGAFNFIYGMVWSASIATEDDLGHDRAGNAGGKAVSKDPQRKWVSHLLLRQMDELGLKRHLAEVKIAKAIHDHIARGVFTPPFSAKWFEDILMEEQKTPLLKSTYLRKKFSKAKMRELVSEPIDDMPPIDIRIPRT